ncbi:hypothetical protein NDU88_001916 [Pleurodeles waltl]|uniref:C2H2-type domain-containing protein n=1 Tax=Pleurodeles waltl TaxID=8319 RepID=A0AAV7RDZ2_PLEWA|nr:hypothetical protein NDU88_001916 [Pleurodeles waltl]
MSHQESEEQEACHDADFFEAVLPVTIFELSDEEFLATDEEGEVHQNANTLRESGPIQTACSHKSCAADTMLERNTCSQDTPHQGSTDPNLKRHLESQEKLGIVSLTSFSGNEGNSLYGVTYRKGKLGEKRKRNTIASKSSKTRGTPVRRYKRTCKGTQGSVNLQGTDPAKSVNHTGCKIRDGKVCEKPYYLRSCSKPEEHHPMKEVNQHFQDIVNLFPNGSCLEIEDLQKNTAPGLQQQTEESPLPTTKTTGHQLESGDCSPSVEKVKEPDEKCRLTSKIVTGSSIDSSVLMTKKKKCQNCSLTFRSARLLSMHIKSDHRHGNSEKRNFSPKRNAYLALFKHKLRVNQRASSIKK